jgi:hypothetical protein
MLICRVDLPGANHVDGEPVSFQHCASAGVACRAPREPVWQPSKELIAAIAKASRGLDCSLIPSLDLSGVLKAINAAAEQQRRLFADIENRMTAAMPASLRGVTEVSALLRYPAVR